MSKGPNYRYKYLLLIVICCLCGCAQSMRGNYSEEVALKTIWLSDAIYEV